MKTLARVSVFTCIMLFHFGTAAQADLVLNMPLDNLSAEDISGNGNHGIKHGALVAVEDRHGNPDGAMRFDGEMDFLVVPLTEAYDVQDEYTISFWIKRAFSTHPSFIMFSTNVSLRLEGDLSSSPGLIMNDNSACPDNPIGEWIHVVATAKSSDQTTIYKNGELVDSAPMGSIGPATGLSIGARHGGFLTDQEFTGDLDDVMIFNQVLTAEEIAELAGLETESEEECIPVSEIPQCEVCEVCEEWVECPGEKDCEEPVELFEGGVTRRAKLHFNEKSDRTVLQVHMTQSGIPEGLGAGPVQIRVQFIQGFDVVEFVSDAKFFERGHNLTNKRPRKKKNCSGWNGKGWKAKGWKVKGKKW